MTTETPTPAIGDTNDVIEAARWLATLQAVVSETVSGVLLRAARPVPIGVGGQGAKVLSSPGSLVGFAVRNLDGGAPATVIIREYSADGAIVLPITLAAGESARAYFGPGINFVDGIHVETTGSVDGSVLIRGAE